MGQPRIDDRPARSMADRESTVRVSRRLQSHGAQLRPRCRLNVVLMRNRSSMFSFALVVVHRSWSSVEAHAGAPDIARGPLRLLDHDGRGIACRRRAALAMTRCGVTRRLSSPG